MNRFFKGLSYTFNRNIGKTDRIIRLVLAVIAIASWYFGLVTGLIGTILGIFALMILGTAATARCGVTYWLDINTMSSKEKKILDRKGILYEKHNEYARTKQL